MVLMLASARSRISASGGVPLLGRGRAIFDPDLHRRGPHQRAIGGTGLDRALDAGELAFGKTGWHPDRDRQAPDARDRHAFLLGLDLDGQLLRRATAAVKEPR